jgi:hypothetical protein
LPPTPAGSTIALVRQQTMRRAAIALGVAAFALAAACRTGSAPARRTPKTLDVADAGPVRIVGRALPPAPREWCAMLASSNASAMAAKLVPDAGCRPPELSCLVDDAGVGWGFEVRDAGSVREGDCTTTVSLGILRNDGRLLSAAEPGTELILSEEADHGLVFQTGKETIEPLGDYDGDGHQEVLITRHWWAHEGGSGRHSTVWTFDGHGPHPYLPASDIGIEGTADADHDGKVDLVTRGPYDRVEAFSQVGYEYPIGPTIFLAHALPDGKFSSTDAVSVAYTEAACKTATEQNEKIVCDRLRGKTEADVLADAKKSGCVDFKEDPNRYPQSCQAWIPELAAIQPPFRIR